MIPKYLWADLETTGLEAADDLILEVAAIVTDKDLVQIGEPFQGLVWNGTVFVDGGVKTRHDIILAKNDFVREMHTKNGLLEELRPETAWSPQRVEHDLINWLFSFPQEGVDPKGLVIAGSSISFDRGFLAVHMPTLFASLHYRQRDVSSDKMLFEDALGMEFPKSEAHRALPDVMRSLGLAQAMFHALQELVRIEKLGGAP